MRFCDAACIPLNTTQHSNHPKEQPRCLGVPLPDRLPLFNELDLSQLAWGLSHLLPAQAASETLRQICSELVKGGRMGQCSPQVLSNVVASMGMVGGGVGWCQALPIHGTQPLLIQAPSQLGVQERACVWSVKTRTSSPEEEPRFTREVVDQCSPQVLSNIVASMGMMSCSPTNNTHTSEGERWRCLVCSLIPDVPGGWEFWGYTAIQRVLVVLGRRLFTSELTSPHRGVCMLCMRFRTCCREAKQTKPLAVRRPPPAFLLAGAPGTQYL